VVSCVFQYRMSSGGRFGGAVTIRPQMFRNINGFPVDYFGEEDDHIVSRCWPHWFSVAVVVVLVTQADEILWLN